MWLTLLAACGHHMGPEVALSMARVAVDEQRGWGHDPEARFWTSDYASGAWTVHARSPEAIGEELVVVVGGGRVAMYHEGVTAR